HLVRRRVGRRLRGGRGSRRRRRGRGGRRAGRRREAVGPGGGSSPAATSNPCATTTDSANVRTAGLIRIPPSLCGMTLLPLDRRITCDFSPPDWGLSTVDVRLVTFDLGLLT